MIQVAVYIGHLFTVITVFWKLICYTLIQHQQWTVFFSALHFHGVWVFHSLHQRVSCSQKAGGPEKGVHGINKTEHNIYTKLK